MINSGPTVKIFLTIAYLGRMKRYHGLDYRAHDLSHGFDVFGCFDLGVFLGVGIRLAEGIELDL